MCKIEYFAKGYLRVGEVAPKIFIDVILVLWFISTKYHLSRLTVSKVSRVCTHGRITLIIEI